MAYKDKNLSLCSLGAICLIAVQAVVLIFIGIFVISDKNKDFQRSVLCPQIQFCSEGASCQLNDGLGVGATDTKEWANASPEWIKYSMETGGTKQTWDTKKEDWAKIIGDEELVRCFLKPEDNENHYEIPRSDLDAMATEIRDSLASGMTANHALTMAFVGALTLPTMIANGNFATAAKIIPVMGLHYQLSVLFALMWRGACLGFFVPDVQDDSFASSGINSCAAASVLGLIVALGAYARYSASLAQLVTFSAVHSFLMTAVYMILYYSVKVVDQGCLSVFFFGGLFGALAGLLTGDVKDVEKATQTTPVEAAVALISITLVVIENFIPLVKFFPVLVGGLFGACIMGGSGYTLRTVHRLTLATFIFHSVADSSMDKLNVTSYQIVTGLIIGIVATVGEAPIAGLAKLVGIKDHCGVFSLHVAVGFLSAFFALLTLAIPMNFHTYGKSVTDFCNYDATGEYDNKKADGSECSKDATDATAEEGSCTVDWIGDFNALNRDTTSFVLDLGGFNPTGPTAGTNDIAASQGAAAAVCVADNLLAGKSRYHPFRAMKTGMATWMKRYIKEDFECEKNYANYKCNLAPGTTSGSQFIKSLVTVTVSTNGKAVQPVAAGVLESEMPLDAWGSPRGEGRGVGGQGGFQFAGILVVMCLAAAGGLITGLLCKLLGGASEDKPEETKKEVVKAEGDNTL